MRSVFTYFWRLYIRIHTPAHAQLFTNNTRAHAYAATPLAPRGLACWGGAGAPPCITTHRSVLGRGWSHAPGAECVEQRLKPQLEDTHPQIRLRSRLASLALTFLGRGWSPAPHHDTPVCSGGGWSHAPGGSVCRAAAEAAARSPSQPYLTLPAPSVRPRAAVLQGKQHSGRRVG